VLGTVACASGPVLSPGCKIVVHGVCEFFQRALEWQGIPTVAVIERQAIGTCAERSESEPGIGAVLVGTAHDQMATAHRHVEAARDLTRFEHRLQAGDDRGEPGNVGSATWSRHHASVPIVGWWRNRLLGDYRADVVAG